ncbi:hypothetical protein BO78DRAFT_397749 [Aspergillus sclerotiicarbonarius CBS 121057]|uniref:Uncharacterized protein n=1 Tax=Aspergillus sclerotiicarbonarius (strain CBS 121057 / IBT 28362) TaxID=1448318 RepID=A0A319EQG9_ASPSB|nr:hypothetical protein BO78DRAFT_397749 [Aspergillus sclerotiicarbonarius CBS 121057]
MTKPPDPWTTRESYRAALRAIRDQIITNLKTDQIDEPQARQAGIQQHNLSLEEGPDAPLFFQPFQEKLTPAEELDYPTYNPGWEDYQNIRALHMHMQNCLAEANQRDYPTPTGVTYKDWGDFNFDELFEPDYFWHVSLTCRTRMDINLPHMKCLLANDIPGDDRLTRGELISIVNIMVGRLHTKHLRPHVLAPVIKCAFMY